MDASDLGLAWRTVPFPFRWTTVPVTETTTMPFGVSSTSHGRSASTSPGRIAVPSKTSTMSRTWPSGFGPGLPLPVRQLAAATRIAAICSKVSACGWVFEVRSDDVPSTGLREIASWRRAKPKSRLSMLRDCLAREYEVDASDFRNHSTRPVVISPSVKCSKAGSTCSRIWSR